MRGSSPSAACWTCKKRRIKCDAGQPHCLRCEKANLSCAGYKPLRKFINHTVGHQVASVQDDHTSRLTAHLTVVDSQLQASSWVPTTQLPLTAFTADISVAFLSTTLFPHQLPGHEHRPESSWILSSIRNDQTSLVLSTTSCLARLYFARSHGQTLPPEAVTRDYNNALALMRSHSKQLSLHKTSFLLAGIICLMFFEMMRPTTLAAVEHHSNAISTIVTRLGPEPFTTQPMHAYFLQARSIIIARDLLHAIKSELSSEEWKTIPWEQGNVKLPRDDLWDLVADTCNLNADTSEVLSASSVSSEDIKVKRNVLISTLRRLAHWRWSWHEEHGSAMYETNVTMTQTFLPKNHFMLGTKLLPLFYTEADLCRDLTLYNATMLHLLRLAYLWNLDTSAIFHEVCINRSLPEQHIVLSLPLPGLTTADIVADIARSMDYHLIQNRFQSSLSFLPLAINAMYRAYLDDSTRLWLRSLTERLVHISGFEFFRMVCAGDANGYYARQNERELAAAKSLQRKWH